MKVVYLKVLEGKPLYVGEGTPSRAACPTRENKIYKDKLTKHKGKHVCTVILSKHTDKVGAVLQEQGFVKWFGRLSTGDGVLTNCLAYGDTSYGTFRPLAEENFDPERERLRSQRVSETRQRKLAEGTLNHCNWFNNGEKETMLHECPEGWEPGRLPLTDEQKQKLRQLKVGRRWWNNGTEQRLQKESPGVGFVPGRLQKATESVRK